MIRLTNKLGNNFPLYDCPENYLNGSYNALAECADGLVGIVLVKEYNCPEDGYKILEDDDAIQN